jgi:hypothetical protein
MRRRIFRFRFVAADLRKPIEMEPIEQILVHAALEALVLRVSQVGLMARGQLPGIRARE